jgi:hypothetical protein
MALEEEEMAKLLLSANARPSSSPSLCPPAGLSRGTLASQKANIPPFAIIFHTKIDRAHAKFLSTILPHPAEIQS